MVHGYGCGFEIGSGLLVCGSGLWVWFGIGDRRGGGGGLGSGFQTIWCIVVLLFLRVLLLLLLLHSIQPLLLEGVVHPLTLQ